MVRRISTGEARALFDDDTDMPTEPLIVESNGNQVAVILSPNAYRMHAWARAEAAMDEMHTRNANEDPDEIERMIADEEDAMKRERREQRERHPTSPHRR